LADRIHSLDCDDSFPEACRGGAVAVGNFDGVHRGHQEILARLAQMARAVSGPAVAVTLDPHPLQLLRPQSFQPVLTTVSARAELLRRYGADHVVILKTKPAFLELSARDFFEYILRGGLQARGLIEGENFGFGKGREGNIAMLKNLCSQAGMELAVVSSLSLDGKPISSSRVRNDLVAGQVARAAQLLGRPFRIDGTVAEGQKRGQILGFPTANLQGIETLVPGNGVYAVRAFHQGNPWPAAANIGPNPTFGEQARKIEVHLIGFEGNLYGERLNVDFIERLRDTRPFPGPRDLVHQLRHDVEHARQILGPQ
jgi:riboflavin kinase / FMN adenylyltransferase